VLIDTYTASIESAINLWKTYIASIDTPPTARYASISIAYSAAGTYYVDQVSLQLGNLADPTYDEARAIDIFLTPNKASVTDNWASTGSPVKTQDVDISSEVYSGVSSLNIVVTDAWSLTSNTSPVTIGEYYTASAYLKPSAQILMSVVTRNSIGDIVDVYTETIETSADWARYSSTLLVPYDSTAVTIEAIFSGDTGTFYIDAVQLEKNFIMSEYFDGSLPADAGAVWEGTTDNSYSHRYYSKPIKVVRLANTLDAWVPPNSFWRLRSYDGVEFNNLTV